MRSRYANILRDVIYLTYARLKNALIIYTRCEYNDLSGIRLIRVWLIKIEINLILVQDTRACNYTLVLR